MNVDVEREFFRAQPLGIKLEHEKALLHALGVDRKWSESMVKCDKALQHYLPHRCSALGILLPHFAEAVEIGIEIGRKLERSPILDALYCRKHA